MQALRHSVGQMAKNTISFENPKIIEETTDYNTNALRIKIIAATHSTTGIAKNTVAITKRYIATAYKYKAIDYSIKAITKKYKANA